MGFKENIIADTDVFLDADYFGESITHTDAGGASSTITAVVERMGGNEEENDRGRVMVTRCRVSFSSTVSGFSHASVFTIDGSDWAVESLGPLDSAIVEAVLVRRANIEVSRQGYRKT